MKTNIFSRSLLLSLFILIGYTSHGIKPIYVSAKGNDSGNGTFGRPFLTLEKARDAIREQRTSGVEESFTILLRGGDYRLTQAVEFGQEDKNITIAPYKNEKVRFTGGISIDPANAKPVVGSNREGIFPLANRNSIFMVNLRELGINDYGEIKRVGFGHPLLPSWMELFVNGKPCFLSRWPNESKVTIGKVLEKGSVASDGDNGNIGGRFTYPGNRPSGWKASDDIWIFGYFHYGWADDVVKLASVDTIGKTFTTAFPHRYGFFSGKSWNAWYAYNIPEEIDMPGEYYIDRKEGVLYFCNRENLATLEVSLMEKPFISMSGSSGITVDRITFECSRGIAVEIKSAKNCLLKNCVFRNLGSYAVNISDLPNGKTGKNSGLYNCTISQTGAGGVKLAGGDRQTLDAAGNYVDNCSISNYNRIFQTYCPGVQITGVGNHIAHCEIFDAPHFAIQLSGNDHLIEYNNIHDVCKVTDDVGALYYGRNPSERGHLVRFNYFHHISDIHSSSAVYHDDGACGMSVFGNVFYKAGSKTVLIGGGSDNPYINNIFIDCPLALYVDNRLQSYDWAKPWVEPGNLYEKNLNEIKYNQPPYSTRYPELARYWDDNPAFPKRNAVDKNVFVRVERVVKGEKSWLVFSENNLITSDDPGFENEQFQNFKLKANSEIFTKIKGFQPIPFDEIGIRRVSNKKDR